MVLYISTLFVAYIWNFGTVVEDYHQWWWLEKCQWCNQGCAWCLLQHSQVCALWICPPGSVCQCQVLLHYCEASERGHVVQTTWTVPQWQLGALSWQHICSHDVKKQQGFWLHQHNRSLLALPARSDPQKNGTSGECCTKWQLQRGWWSYLNQARYLLLTGTVSNLFDCTSYYIARSSCYFAHPEIQPTFDHDHVDINGADGRLRKTLSFL